MSNKPDHYITGAFGFIGSSLVRHLNEKGIIPFIIQPISRIGIQWKNLAGADFILFDDSGDGIFGREQDFLIHLGANVTTTELFNEELWNNNVTYSLDLFKRFGGKIIYASSFSVYGLSKECDEDNWNQLPVNPYAFTKFQLDKQVFCRSELFHKINNICSLRFSNCYDEKTELLTEHGFRYIKDVTTQDKIATLNPENNNLEYHIPTEVHKILYRGKMIHFNGRRHDILCTPDQNLYISKTHGKYHNYELVSAQKIIDENWYQAVSKTTVDWIGANDPEYEIIPESFMTDGRTRHNLKEKKIPIDKWLTFLGWFLSEGSVYCGKDKKSGNMYYRVNIAQHKDKNKIEEIVHICEEIGFHVQRTFKKGGALPTGVTIHNKQLYEYLSIYRLNKYISTKILKYSKKLLIILFETLMKGDGNSDGRRYTTKYKHFADSFQELLFKIGKLGFITEEINGKFKIYRIHIAKNDYPQIGNCEKLKVNYELIDFHNYVYDVTVKNHIIFIRRNGRVCWSGNCYGPAEGTKGPMGSVIYKWLNDKKVEFDSRNGVSNKLKLFKSNIPEYTDGEQKRDFIYVNDVCKVIWHLCQDNNFQSGIFNLGSGIASSWNQVAKEVLAARGLPSDLVEYVDMPQNLIGQYQNYTCANLTKLREIMGYKEPMTSLADGVKLTWEKLKNG